MCSKTVIAVAVALALGFGATVPGTASAATVPQTASSAAPPNATTKKSTKKKKVQTLQQINVVSAASLIQRAGMMVPTPAVSVSPQVLNLQTSANLGQAINALPYAGQSSTVANTSGGHGFSAGSTNVNLRGLGASHTLILVDGNRFVGTEGVTANLNSIPSILVSGIQVVTGGESATWGSGAVAGVVNVQLKHNLQGLILNSSIGLSDARDAQRRKFGIAYGTSYANGKGHITFGLNYFSQGSVGPSNSMSVRGGEGYGGPVQLANGKIVLLPGVGQTNAAPGGIITSGVLSGFGFNPNGTLASPNLGNIVAKGTSSGGFGATDNAADPIIGPQHYYTFLGETHYDLTSDVQVYAQFIHDSSWANYPWFSPPFTGITISADNAFLQPSIRNTLMKAGENSFQMGYDYNASISDRPIIFRRGDDQFLVGLKGTMPDDWHWTTSLSYGDHINNSTIYGYPLRQNWENALDSIVDPTTESAICGVALDDPSTACAPLDLFGVGNASPDAVAYVTSPFLYDEKTNLGVWSFKVQGEPFSLPAGLVSTAFGVDYRQTGEIMTLSPNVSSCKFLVVCITGLGGNYNVKEGFGEVLAPLVKHSGVLNNLNFDGAFRYSDYSLSGPIWSWKAGFINTFGAGISGRVDFSRDIRAPNIQELFSANGHELFTITNPFNNTNQIDVPYVTGGNRALKPEKANTFTAGILWTPKWNPSLNASVDFYRISGSGIISEIGGQTLVDQCAAGLATACANVTRSSDGEITLINGEFTNLGNLSESGVDVDFAYSQPAVLFGQRGKVRIRALATWVHYIRTTQSGITTNYLSSMSQGFGMPRWTGILSAGFYGRRFSVHGRLRFISSTEYNANENIVNNYISPYYYLDLGASYNFGPRDGMQVYFDVLNVTNKLAPLGMWLAGASDYDYMGRYYTVGWRLRM